jgi:hypothetical protein
MEMMVSVTPRPRCHHGNNPQYLFIRNVDEPQSRPGRPGDVQLLAWSVLCRLLYVLIEWLAKRSCFAIYVRVCACFFFIYANPVTKY